MLNQYFSQPLEISIARNSKRWYEKFDNEENTQISAKIILKSHFDNLRIQAIDIALNFIFNNFMVKILEPKMRKFIGFDSKIVICHFNRMVRKHLKMYRESDYRNDQNTANILHFINFYITFKL